MKIKNRLYKFLFVLIVLLINADICVVAQNAQTNKKLKQPSLKGVVVDKMNNTLQGVIVSVVNNDISAYTEFDGSFSIPGIFNASDKLCCAIDGYYTKVLEIGKDDKIVVQLSKDVASSNQYIPLLHDSRPAYTVGASAVTISGDELRKSHQTNVAAALAGRVSGLYVRTNSSEPGSETYSVTIRGASSTNNASPLVLIDGRVSSLGSLNLMDVESVTVMKDASSTMFYSMQAANGLISVKTRRGVSGLPSITVDANMSFQEAIKTPNMLNSFQYASLMNEAWKNDGAGDNYKFSEEQLAGYKSGENTDLYPNNNWYNMFLKKVVKTQNIHVNATGGGKFVKYYTSVAYRHQENPFNTDNPVKKYEKNRFEVLSNLDVKLNEMIRGYVGIVTRVDRNTNPNEIGMTNARQFSNVNGNIMNSIFDLSPANYGPLTPDGKTVVSTDKTNSTYGRINRSGYVKQTDLDLSTNIGLEFNLSSLVPGLKASAETRYNTSSLSNTYGTTNYERWIRDPNRADSLKFVQFGSTEKDPLLFNKNVTTSLRSQFEVKLDYNRTFGSHSAHAILTAMQDYYNADNVVGDQAIYRLLYGGQASYGYSDILFADFGASIQGSEKFSEDFRYGFYPSGAVAMVMSNMNFLKNDKTLTYLKLRGSYGVVASDEFATDGRFLYKDDFVGSDANSSVNYLAKYINERKFGNPFITSEKTHKLNVGVDLSLWNQISVGVDYFNDNRTDILVEDLLTPATFGINEDNRAAVNKGEINCQGFDLQLAYSKDINKDLSIGINTNLSFYKNEVKNLEEIMLSEDYAYRYRKTGYRLGQNWGYEIDKSNGNGYFNSQDEITNSNLTYEGKQPRTGDFIYTDQNNDNVIDQKDLVPMGETNKPQISWGAEVSMRWKNFDLSILFQGLGKVGGFNSGIGFYENYNQGTFFTNHLNAWTAERYAAGDKITAPALTTLGSSSQKSNNYYYQDKSFARLKNLEIGYTMPSKFSKALNSKQVRVYASGINLLTFASSDNENRDVEGGAVNTFPTSKYFTVGCNVTF